MNDEVEKILSSLLTSSKRSMTVKRFCKEFEEMVGYPVPFKQNGYSSVVDFLKSMPHTVMVMGTDLNAELQPVLNEKSYHIHDMVMKQKESVRKFRGNRRHYHMLPQQSSKKRFHNNVCNFTNAFTTNRPVFNQRSTHQYSEQNKQSTSQAFNVQVQEIVHNKVEPKVYNENNCDAYSNKGPNVNENITQNKRVTPPSEVCDPESSSSLSDTNTSNTNNNNNLNSSQGADSNSNLNNSQGAIPRRLEELRMIGPFEQTKKTCRVPKFVVDRLQMIIDQYPDGVTCNSLPHLYFEKFGESLTFAKYGYPSLIFMCKDINIFYIVQPEVGDYQLYNRKNKKPKSKYLLSVDDSDLDVGNSSDSSHALEIDNFQTFLYYPPEVVKYEDKIPGQWIDSDTKEGSFINVVVTEVYDPSKFWIVINIGNLNMFMDDLQHFYKSNSNLKMPKSHMKVGLMCVAILYQEFHRVMICNIASINTNEIRVFAFDYGSVRVVSVSDVYYLHTKFATFPQQCIRARLAKICPPVEKTPWCRKARFNFCNYVSDKMLVAQIHKILEHNTLSLYLIDKENNMVINDTLVEDKVAVITSEVQKPWQRDEKNFPIINEIHMVPLFEDLENGTAYNFDERLDLERKSFPLSTIFPKYFKDMTEDISDLTNECFNFEGLNKSFIEALENAINTIHTEKNINETSETLINTNESVETQSDSVQESDNSNKEELSASGPTKSRNFKKNDTETKIEQPIQNVVVNNVTNDEQPKQPEKKVRPPPGYTEMDLLRNRQYNALVNNPNKYNLVYQAQNPMSMNYGSLQMNVFNHFMPVPQPVVVPSMIPIMPFNPFVNINPYFNLNQFVQPPKVDSNRQFNFSSHTSMTDSRLSSPNLSSCNLNTSKISMEHFNQTDLSSAYLNQSNLSSSTNTSEEHDTSYDTASEFENLTSNGDQQQQNHTTKLLQNCNNNLTDKHTLNYPFDLVKKVDLKSKSIHVIFYDNNAFALVNELLDNYTAANLPMTRITRLVNLKTSWNIQTVNFKDCPPIKDSLLRFGLITKYHIKNEIHLIPVDVIPEFLAIFGISIDDDKFEVFLNTLNL